MLWECGLNARLRGVCSNGYVYMYKPQNPVEHAVERGRIGYLDNWYGETGQMG